MADGQALAVVQQKRSVVVDMAERFGMEPAAFHRTIRSTVVPANCTDEQFAAFLLVAKQYQLNPLVKEIFAFPAKGGGIVPVVSVDGWARIINDHPQMDGLEFEDHREGAEIVAITAKIYRKDRRMPVSVTEYMAECRRETDTWKKWPARMLRHKATIQAARYAFGFSGIYDQDEAERLPSGEGLGGSNLEPKKSSAGAKRDGEWTRIQAEIDACETRQELQRWLDSNERRIEALPNEHWRQAARDRAELRLERLADEIGPAIEEAADESLEEDAAFLATFGVAEDASIPPELQKRYDAAIVQLSAVGNRTRLSQWRKSAIQLMADLDDKAPGLKARLIEKIADKERAVEGAA